MASLKTKQHLSIHYAWFTKMKAEKFSPAGDMEYFSFEETDSAKHSENPNEYLGVYLSEGASIDCSVGYFMPKGTVTNTKDLFLLLV